MSQLNRRRFMSMSAAFGMIALSKAEPAAAASPAAPKPFRGAHKPDPYRGRAPPACTGNYLPAPSPRHTLDRIAIYNPKLNVFITVMRENALTQAAELDRDAQAGRFRGPLHGVPIVLKDNIDTAGTRTTAASQVFDDRVPTEDAFVTAKIKAAGAVIMAKANMHEFAMGHTSASTYFGPVRNPWAPDRTPAGSSGGCGTAVISDLCAAAVGTDTGGSVRMPAAYCSMVGLKPTYGLVSIRGIVPLTYSLDHCGPMTHTVQDAALLLTTMAGYDKLDIASVEHPHEDFTQTMKQSVSKLRLGIPRAPLLRPSGR